MDLVVLASFMFMGIAAIMLFAFAALSLTLVRRAKKELESLHGTEDQTPIIVRIPLYTKYTISRVHWRDERRTLIDYGDFDFRSFANPLEKALSIVLLISFLIIAVSSIAACIADFLSVI